MSTIERKITYGRGSAVGRRCLLRVFYWKDRWHTASTTAVGTPWRSILGFKYRRRWSNVEKHLSAKRIEVQAVISPWCFRVEIWAFNLIFWRKFNQRGRLKKKIIGLSAPSDKNSRRRTRDVPHQHHWSGLYHVLLSWVLILDLYFEHLHCDSLSIIWYSNLDETLMNLWLDFILYIWLHWL